MPTWYGHCWSNCFRLFIKTTYKETRSVNAFGLPGKVAANCAEAEFPSDASKFSRVSSCSMKSEGTTLAQFISAGARKRSLLLQNGFSSTPAPLFWFNVG
jgi:hypothetical protein